jgi:catechol 2,3-dioxygenase-like lactoylglutathione lyase family enzyme
MGTWLGQYCINVTDLDRAVAFYETLGLECTSRTDIEQAREAIVESRDRTGAKLQLAQQLGQGGPIEMGSAFWKLYVNTNDIEAAHQAAVDAGHTSVVAPMRLEQWPMSIAFVADPDGYQVELCQRHPWQDDPDGTAAPWLGQYCINVSDLDASVARYEALGLECTSRTEIPQAFEAILEQPGKGGKMQLAQQKEQAGPIDMGTAMWKLYVNTDDIDETFGAALDAGFEVSVKPERLERWPVTIAFVTDPDGYLVELVQRHPD